MHSVCSSLPAAAVEWLVQVSHVSTDVAAVVVEYVLGPHSVQGGSPVCSLYVPALQAVHSTPSEPEYPAIQVQSVTNSLCGPENVKAGHSVQVVDEEAPLAPE